MDIAIDALAQVLLNAPTARLVIAGVGRAIPELQAKVAAMGLEAHIHFAGAVSDVERTRLIDASLAVLMPSRWREGFGIVAVEAAQRARPVITAQAGALGETVTQLKGGIVLATNDAKALATAMQQFLHDPDAAMRLGAQGRQQAERLFNIDRFITRVMTRCTDKSWKAKARCTIETLSVSSCPCSTASAIWPLPLPALQRRTIARFTC